MNGPRRGEKGQALVVAILLLSLALIMIPFLIRHIQNEARWTLKESRATTAYHLAEAAQERGLWYLTQSTANWASALAGNVSSGYGADVQYSDISGGLYDIDVTSGPLSYQVTILTKGRDSSSKEIRAIRAVYSGAALQSGLITQGALSNQPNLTVHWGQLVSYTSISLPGAPAYYPFRDSAGSISPWSTSPTPPTQSATKNYYAYDPNLTTPPQVDFNYYRLQAQNTVAPDPEAVSHSGSNGGQTTQWRGTGYFDGSQQIKLFDYQFNCSTCVLFAEHSDVLLESGQHGNAYMHVAALIVYTGNIHVHGNGANPYVVSVPTAAWQQYTAATVDSPQGPGDSSSTDEYPGDCGYHSACQTYSIPTAKYDGNGGTGMTFHGFLYAYSFNCSGANNSQVGSIWIGPGGTSLNTMVLYYDPAVAAAIHYAKSPINRASWQELATSWP